MIIEELLQKIVNLKRQDSKMIDFNKRYLCEFIFSNDDNVFGDWLRDPNCPRSYSTADVRVYDTKTSEFSKGILTISLDRDLICKMSMTLKIEDPNAKTSMLNAVDVKIVESKHVDFSKA